MLFTPLRRQRTQYRRARAAAKRLCWLVLLLLSCCAQQAPAGGPGGATSAAQRSREGVFVDVRSGEPRDHLLLSFFCRFASFALVGCTSRHITRGAGAEPRSANANSTATFCPGKSGPTAAGSVATATEAAAVRFYATVHCHSWSVCGSESQRTCSGTFSRVFSTARHSAVRDFAPVISAYTSWPAPLITANGNQSIPPLTKMLRHLNREKGCRISRQRSVLISNLISRSRGCLPPRPRQQRQLGRNPCSQTSRLCRTPIAP